MEAQAHSSAFDEWEHRQLERFRQEYIDAGDLHDAVGILDDGQELLNAVWKAVVQSNLLLTLKLLAEIMDKGAEANANYRLKQEMHSSMDEPPLMSCLNCQHFSHRQRALVCQITDQPTHILDKCDDWRKRQPLF